MAREHRFWHVDAFAARPFAGNPAAVIAIDEEIDDAVMLALAREMNLSEAAFVLERGAVQPPLLRWFTSLGEIDLCGHATLASAHAILGDGARDEITFDAAFAGKLRVRRRSAVPEDPVTGSAHCTLAPYWAGRLGKSKMLAYQASRRGGEIGVEVVAGGRVTLAGSAVTVVEGVARF